jgi:5,5'-dehydrodivanillate O-demethylase oxygenase subunit
MAGIRQAGRNVLEPGCGVIDKRVTRTHMELDFVHTGPGTLAGRYMRMFWHPVFRAQDLPAGRAFPIRVMSENFTLYRGETGIPYVVGPRCAHRRTQLSVGRVEGDCIRCLYHGWKYDGCGQCVEAPAEDEGFARSVRVPSYPTREYLGLIFAYLGEGSPPELSHFPELEAEGVLEVETFRRDCNFFNHMDLDLAHIAFVHRDSPEADAGLVGIPEVDCEETSYGFVLIGKRGKSVQLQHRLMPNVSYFKVFPKDAASGWRDRVAWRVPIDDGHYRSFMSDLAHVSGEAADAYRRRNPPPVDHSELISKLSAAVRAGARIEDMKDQTPDVVFLQDDVVLTAQGAIPDRAQERLGAADKSVVLTREIWRRELKALAEGRPLTEWTRPKELVAKTGV